jgi:regulator of sirC expression with transglutaminase-like and TPR domain
VKTELQEKQHQELERLLAELDPAVAELRAYVVELTPSLAIKKTEAVLNLLRSRYSFAGALRKPRQR